MSKINDLEYFKLNKFQKIWYKTLNFLSLIPKKIKGLFIYIFNWIKTGFKRILSDIKQYFIFFVKGDIKNKISYFIMGFSHLCRGQILRGLLFLLFEIIFFFYMFSYGFNYIGKLGSLGEVAAIKVPVEVEILPGISQIVYETKYVDNSFKYLLYGVLSIFFIIAFIYTYRLNIKQNIIAKEILDSGKKIKSGKDDLKSLLDDKFHSTLLALPVLGITLFTVLPIIFMILISFTNFDSSHTPPDNLFDWVGLDNYNQLLVWSSDGVNFAATFGEILSWTLIWAFFATFTNYFLGMLVAMLINKQGIKFKKVFRTILVLTIAVPQFISLLYISRMFSTSGIINGLLMDLGIINKNIDFWGNKNLARIMVILINIWVGVPYLMLIATGILMNIPKDLYESAKIDGANSFQQYYKITLPYMLFVTGPYLLTSFIANMNNFNVIYLLTGGAPNSVYLTGGAGYTDLQITWLYKLTVDSSNYKLASCIGVLVFIVIAVISLIVYNLIPSTKNEEDYQ